MSTPNTQLSLRNEIESPAFRDAVAKVLPKILPPDRFVRVAITAMTRTPKLRECDRASFFSAMLSLAQTGLEPDGRRAHLIPFENRKRGVVECQLIIDYKGLAELAMRSGLLSYLHADVVRRGDIFRYSLGEIKEHVPHFLRDDQDKPEKAGDVFAAFAVARFKDGSAKVTQSIYLARDNHKAIVIGKGGTRIKQVREAAQHELQEMMGRQVHLFLFVKVRENWQEDPERYREMGLDFET